MSTNKNLKPFFTYYGGKFRSTPKFPKPKHSTIIEPFAGSAGYSVRYPDRNVKLFDLDTKICELWEYLINVSQSEILALPLVFDNVSTLNISTGAKHLIGFWCNKGAAQPCNKPSKWMRGGTHINSFWGEAIRCRIAKQLEYIRHWEIHNCSYIDIPNIEATWFVDPPYRSQGKHYKHGSKHIDYECLAEFSKDRLGQVIVCEQFGEDWLDFNNTIDIKNTPGVHKDEKVSKEVFWYKE